MVFNMLMSSGLNRRFNRATYIVWFCTAILAGLLLGRKTQTDSFTILLSGVSALVLISRRSLTGLLAVVIFGVVIGVNRGSLHFESIAQYGDLYGQQILIKAVALNDAVYGDSGQLTFDAGSIEVQTEEGLKSLPGQIRVQGFGALSVSRSDVVQLEGKLFPTGGSKQAKFSYGTITVLQPDTSTLENIRRRFVAGMFNAIPEPQASFGLGLLIGQRTTLPSGILTALSIAGLTHIIAVSGYNLTIIVRIMRRLLGKRSKYQSVAFSFALIALFIFVTGFSASIVRAAVVSVLSLLAWYYGRAIKPMVLLLLSAALTAYWDPVYVWSDIGWYLSFLAFFGVLVIAPLVKQRLYGDREQRLIGQVVLESVCAQLMAAPLILYIFGEVSLIALVSNALIVPLVPLAMLGSLIAGVFGMFAPVVSGIFGFPATIVLTYMLDVVQMFARFPGALLKSEISFIATLYVYGLLGLFTILLHYAVKRKYGKITDRNIIE